MNEKNEKQLESCLKEVFKGEHLSGIVFRLAGLLGSISIFLGIYFYFSAPGKVPMETVVSYFSSGIKVLLFAWFVSIIRDTFRAIRLIVEELKQIV